MNNQKIADIFFEIADILEVQNIEWKPRAYRQAARAIGSLQRDVKEIYFKGGIKALEEIPGVGKGIGKKIVEFLKNKKIKEHQRLIKKAHKHINVLLKIPGMGIKKLEKLRSLNISSIKQLEKAALKHKIASLEGFDKKSEQDILEGIAIMKKSKGRISYKKARKIADSIITNLKQLKEVKKIEAAGSLRRKKLTIGDIDIIVLTNNPKKVIEAFIKQRNIKVLAKGSLKAAIVLKSGIQVDLRVFDKDSYGAGLFYFTGSKNYGINLRKIAIKKGLKLSEYGLFDKGKKLAGKTEQEICKKLGIKYLKPEDREK